MSQSPLASCGIEALTAFLAKLVDDLHAHDPTKFPNKSQVEAQLEALSLSSQLHDQTIDLGPKFEEASHNSTFTSISGGISWKLRPDVEDRKQSVAPTLPQTDPLPNSSPKPLPEPLPEPLANQLDTVVAQIDQALAGLLADVNQLQAAYDRGQRVTRSLRRDIYADWNNYMVCCYRPPDSHESDYPDADEVKRLVEKQVLMLYLTQVFVGLLQVKTDGPVSATVMPLDPNQFHLTQFPPAAIAGLGSDLWNQLPSPTLAEDIVAEEQRRLSFLADFVKWCPGFVEGHNDDIAQEVLDLLGKGVYDTTDQAFWEWYPPDVAEGRCQFEFVAQKLANQLNPLAQCATQLNNVHAVASQVKPDAQAILNALKTLPEPIQPAIGSLLEDAETLSESQQKALANQVAALIPPWLLQQSAAPRFWQPNEPVLLLAGLSMQPSDRHGEDGDSPGLLVDLDPRGVDAHILQQLGLELAVWSPHQSPKPDTRVAITATVVRRQPLPSPVSGMGGRRAAVGARWQHSGARLPLSPRLSVLQLPHGRNPPRVPASRWRRQPHRQHQHLRGTSILVTHARDVLSVGISRYLASLAHSRLLDKKDQPGSLSADEKDILVADTVETDQ